MRIAALSVSALLLVVGGCASTSNEDSSYSQPNSLMAEEIESRVKQIPFQHREELLDNLKWLVQTGETTIPTLLRGLSHESPKVRSNCAWALGMIRDRRTIPQLQRASKDSNESVRLEIARALVWLGDVQQSPTLIEGLDSDKKEVRYLCHEALKGASGRDFGYDHLTENEQRELSSFMSPTQRAKYFGIQDELRQRLEMLRQQRQQRRGGGAGGEVGEGRTKGGSPLLRRSVTSTSRVTVWI